MELKEEQMMSFLRPHFPTHSFPEIFQLHHLQCRVSSSTSPVPIVWTFVFAIYTFNPRFKYLLIIKHHHLGIHISVIHSRTTSRPCSHRQHIEQVAICATRVRRRHKISPDHHNLPSNSPLSDRSSGQIHGHRRHIPHDCPPPRQAAKLSGCGTELLRPAPDLRNQLL